ncbi:MAG: 4-coumarate--CoA ligase [Beijerinckiaceae bacterium]
MSAFILSEHHRHRLLVSLIAEELGKLQERTVNPAESLGWTSDMQLGEEASDNSLGLDSLGRIDIASRINQFFHLHESGIEDYLLIEKTIGRWNFIVAEAEKLSFKSISFQTSGSTGAPKVCTHSMLNLLAEADELIRVLGPFQRIVSLVPPHHIYGFIFTVLLPEKLQCTVIDARAMSPGGLRQTLQAGDMIVATPHLWSYLLASLPGFPEGIAGTTSTAPMPPVLAGQLRDKGLKTLTEIYGSSETAGIGWRQDSAAAFHLFDDWVVSADQQAIARRSADGSTQEQQPFADMVQFEGERMLRPTGRRDGAVQVGGVNVFPDKVRDALCQHPDVKEAAVRAFAVGGDAARQRLKAFVVLKDQTMDVAAAEKTLRQHAATLLSDVACPTAYRFGAALPVNAMGKLTDWT